MTRTFADLTPTKFLVLFAPLPATILYTTCAFAEQKWHFQEDITPEFCVSLSLLHRAYGCRVQETGHKTVGHTCVTDRDKVAAREVKVRILALRYSDDKKKKK